MHLHIAGGGLALMAGATALVVRKGGRAHRIAGLAFVVSMTVMAGIGAGVAPLVPARLSVLGGLATCYLVATAWLTVWRPAGEIGRLEIGAFCGALGLCVMILLLASEAARSAAGTVDDQPWQGIVLFGVVMPLAAGGDLRLLVRGGIAGVSRIARHLWRMCMALFIAATSFFLGQPDSLPALLRGSALVAVPSLATLAVMGYWLVRIRRRPPAAVRGIRNRPQERAPTRSPYSG